MGTRTVRLGADEEEMLGRLKESTGESVSALLKRGLQALDRARREDAESAGTAWEIYSSLDLGPGGYAAGPAADSRESARRAIPKRHARDR